MMALQPQAALETAALKTVEDIPEAKLRLEKGSGPNCGRTFDAQPPPACGKLWISVWSDGSRKSQSKTSLDELYGFSVTITLRAVKPWDRWLDMRDHLEYLHNLIRARLHRDCYNNELLRLASALMGADGPGQKVGFREVNLLDRLEGVQVAGPQWFQASLEHPSAGDAGAYQTAHYSGARLIQNLATME